MLPDHSREEDKILTAEGRRDRDNSRIERERHKTPLLFWLTRIPIYQNLGGEHEELKFETLTGVNVSLLTEAGLCLIDRRQ